MRSASPRTSDGVTFRLFRWTRSIRFRISLGLICYAREHISEFDVMHVHSYYLPTCLTVLLAPRDIPGRVHAPLPPARRVYWNAS